jgi:hypothetical protein
MKGPHDGDKSYSSFSRKCLMLVATVGFWMREYLVIEVGTKTIPVVILNML